MIKPLKDRVLVRPDEIEETTASGIILTTKNDGTEKPGTGTVVKIGPEVDMVKEDDKIIHQAYAGTMIKIDGKDYCVLKQDEILGVMHE